MPLTRPITCEEDITMTLSTVITGLTTKYVMSGRVGAKEVLASIFANTAIGLNELIEGSNMSMIEKAALRKDMKTICARAFRAPMNIVTPDGQRIQGMSGETANESEEPEEETTPPPANE